MKDFLYEINTHTHMSTFERKGKLNIVISFCGIFWSLTTFIVLLFSLYSPPSLISLSLSHLFHFLVFLFNNFHSPSLLPFLSALLPLPLPLSFLFSLISSPSSLNSEEQFSQ